MKKMNKWFIWLVIVIFSFSIVFMGIGCKEEVTPTEEAVPTEEEVSEEAVPTEEPITIDFWVIAGNENDMWQKFKELYEAEHPNVTIDITINEHQDHIDLVPSALASGQEKLDLLFHWGGGKTDEWAREGLLLDLTQYAEDNGWYDQMYEGAQDYIIPGLGTFFLSTDWIISPLVYYNVPVFEELGITPPTTLDEIFTVSEKLKENGYEPWTISGGKNPYNLAHIYNQLLVRFLSKEDATKYVMWGRDPNKSAETAEIFRSEGAIKAFDFLQKMAKEGVFAEGFSALDFDSARLLFTDEKAAMFGFGMWEVNIIKESNPDLNFDYYLMPSYDGNDAMVASFTNGIIVPSYVSEEKIPVIVDIISSFLKKEYAAKAYESGLISPSKNITPEEVSELIDPMVARIIADVGKYGSIDIIDIWTSPIRTEVYVDAVVGVSEGSLTPEEAGQIMYDTALEELEQ